MSTSTPSYPMSYVDSNGVRRHFGMRRLPEGFFASGFLPNPDGGLSLQWVTSVAPTEAEVIEAATTLFEQHAEFDRSHARAEGGR